MEIERIGFGFENCIYFEIEGKYLFDLRCEDISTTFDMGLLNSPSISAHKRIKKFSIGIFAEAANAKLLKASSICEGYIDTIGMLEDCYNLVGVDLLFRDSNSKKPSPLSGYYYLPWGGDDNYVNKAIRCASNDRGDIFIDMDLDYVNSDKPSQFIAKYKNEEDYIKMVAEKRDFKSTT